MSLNMTGFVDNTFKSINAVRTSRTGSYVDGVWTAGIIENTSHNINLQPASLSEIQSLENGGERLNDVRRVYLNDGIVAKLAQSDVWEFEGINGVYKTIQLDNRPWHNYCKIIVSIIDDINN